MDVQELYNLKKVLTIWAKNLNSIINKINNTKSSMIGMKLRDAFKLGIIRLDKSEKYQKQNRLSENALHWYLCQSSEQHKDKKGELQTLSGINVCTN